MAELKVGVVIPRPNESIIRSRPRLRELKRGSVGRSAIAWSVAGNCTRCANRQTLYLRRVDCNDNLISILVVVPNTARVV